MRDLGRAMMVAGLLLGAMAGAGGCRTAAVPMPLAQLDAGQMRGHATFQVRCAVCHNDRVDDAKNGPSMVGLFKKPELPSGAAATDERVTATVRQGRGMMPAAGADLDPEEMRDLLAYLHTL